MTEQQNTPELRFPGFERKWEILKLNEVLENKTNGIKRGPFGGALKKEIFINDGYAVYEQKNAIYDNQYFRYYIDKDKYEEMKLFAVKPEDIIMSCSGTIGKLSKIPKNYKKGIINQALIRFRTNSHVISQFFLIYMRSNIMQRKILEANPGSAIRNLIPVKELKNLRFPLPTLEEQQKIGDFFSKLDRQIELEEQKLELLEQQNMAYIHQIFSKILKFKDDKGNKYPEWVPKKLGDIGKVVMNKRIYKNETTENGEIPFYKIGNFGKSADTFITREKFNEYKEKYPYPNVGDILISASGSIGRTIEYTGEDAYYQDSNIVWLDHNDEVLNKYLKYFYKIVKWAGVEGTTIKRLYNKNILNTMIDLPNIEEQKKISSFLTKLEELVEKQSSKVELLKECKRGLLQKMFV
ncbi:restriction endonuclease subunit S [Staphylococcus caprae]|uniref:restriction endonuclease subunit S n=1 Tax=Staphylococcus caprae TaxID=29380 RepID=UPI00080B5179|nr:restriction endonuclease subunit S [Staphylococcus caprae]QJE25953.1 restriction endonuclease subunit S [Staphylococcus caprae]